MSKGITIELAELISLASYVQSLPLSSTKPTSLRQGSYRSNFHGRGMDFSEARHYQAGDDIKHMEWKVTARTGKPHVKLYTEERERPVILLVDFNPSMYFGTKVMFKSVLAAKLAAILAWNFSKQGDRVGGILSSANGHHEFIPRPRDLAVLPILSELSKYTKQKPSNENKSSLSLALSRLARVAKPGSLIIILSDFYSFNDECEHSLSLLANKHNMFCYHILDPIEVSPPKAQIYSISNGIETVVWDMQNTSCRKNYQNLIDLKIDKLKSCFIKQAIQYIQVTTDQDLSLLINSTFPRRRNG